MGSSTGVHEAWIIREELVRALDEYFGEWHGTPRTRAALAVSVQVAADALAVELDDGRTISVPVAWYPRLLRGNAAERANWRLIGRREGIHWPDLDEDISVGGLLAGHPSGESQSSLKRWLQSR